MRTRPTAMALSLLASLVVASVAAAGGWAQVTGTNVPTDPQAGEEATIGLNVLQHGVTPVSWPGLTVVATDATTGTVIRAVAQAKGPEGSYVATIVFPSAGKWTLTFDSKDLVMEGLVSMTVALPAAAALPGAAAATAPAFDVVPLVLVLLAAVVSLLIVGQMLRNRGASGDPRVSAGT